MAENQSLLGLNDDATLRDVMLATYNEMDAEFQERIEAGFDSDADLQEFGNHLMEYEPGANKFIYQLINQIGMIRVNYNTFNSPLKMFKKGMLEFGDTVEDIYTEPVKGMLYRAEVPNDNPGDQFATFKPDTDVVFYKQNKEFVYPVTINAKTLKKAFRSFRELDKFISGIMAQLTNADEIDDYALTMKLLENYGDVDGKNLYYQVHVDDVVDGTTAKELVKAVRSIIPTLKFPSRKFNSKGVLNWSRPEDMYLLVTPDIQAQLDVEVLAVAFNMNKADFMGHVVQVAGFGDLENTVALLVSSEFFQIYDTLKEMHSTGLNALHLTTNYFLHHHGIFALSPFYPAIQFTTAEVSPVDSVSISGLDIITKGANPQIYTASVVGGMTGAVRWSVVGNPQYATINQNGSLGVGAEFPGNSLQIKAVSVEDETKYATFDIVVRAEGQPRGITVSGDTEITIDDSDDVTETYTAVVKGDSTNSVKWSLDKDTYTGISINADTGVLTVAKTAVAADIKVIATSTILTSLKAVYDVSVVAGE